MKQRRIAHQRCYKLKTKQKKKQTKTKTTKRKGKEPSPTYKKAYRQERRRERQFNAVFLSLSPFASFRRFCSLGSFSRRFDRDHVFVLMLRETLMAKKGGLELEVRSEPLDSLRVPEMYELVSSYFCSMFCFRDSLKKRLSLFPAFFPAEKRSRSDSKCGV